jgi:hypothetical protein
MLYFIVVYISNICTLLIEPHVCNIKLFKFFSIFGQIWLIRLHTLLYSIINFAAASVGIYDQTAHGIRQDLAY